MKHYVHGYSLEETIRLNDQADSLADLLHHDTIWPDDSLVLEAGCGVGAQMKTIAPQNKKVRFISIDISAESLAKAQEIATEFDIDNVEFRQADIFHLPFPESYFDHIFVCFVLEHIQHPVDALTKLKQVLKPGGTIIVIEGDHGSTYFHPDSEAAHKAIQCQVILQKQKGGDANIGRRIYPLLQKAGFQKIKVSPRQVYVDDSNPRWVRGFTRNTFTVMIQGISQESITKKLISEEEMKRGIEDLLRTAEGGGTFCYTFFKGIGTK